MASEDDEGALETDLPQPRQHRVPGQPEGRPVRKGPRCRQIDGRESDRERQSDEQGLRPASTDPDVLMRRNVESSGQTARDSLCHSGLL
ncbi:hypothetical protein [Cereibacter sphaeroides]|uniref:hypothetical protein n=1 Tax=Cereibacter sphaeroides TaxID=1063 RepID=UPI000F5424D5|nr:hypothetical protein [Cereibacter sphaeroides]AZB70708.1 hypothetical protein EBL86_20320 [Cereibacter sphaeroides]